LLPAQWLIRPVAERPRFRQPTSPPSATRPCRNRIARRAPARRSSRDQIVAFRASDDGRNMWR
jgi:hypothetical protein